MCWTGNDELSCGLARAQPAVPNAWLRGRKHVCQRSKVGWGSKTCALSTNACFSNFSTVYTTRKSPAWAKWMADQVNLASLRGACAGNHWDSLKELMPVYRAITVTDVGNGVRTSFWLDRWLPAGILMEVFPALYTHSLHKDASVAEVLSSQFRAHFASRLT